MATFGPQRLSSTKSAAASSLRHFPLHTHTRAGETSVLLSQRKTIVSAQATHESIPAGAPTNHTQCRYTKLSGHCLLATQLTSSDHSASQRDVPTSEPCRSSIVNMIDTTSIVPPAATMYSQYTEPDTAPRSRFSMSMSWPPIFVGARGDVNVACVLTVVAAN